MTLLDYIQAPNLAKQRWYESLNIQVGLRYFGGKSIIGKKILNVIFEMQSKMWIDGKKADIFIDAFTGGGKIALSIPEGWFKTIVMNDLDKGVYNFYIYCKNEPDKLIEMIEALGKAMSEDLFHLCAEKRNTEDVEPLASAAMTFWVTAASWMGDTDAKGISYALSSKDHNETKEIENYIQTAKKRIYEIHMKMQRQDIIIENMTYQDLIKKYSGGPNEVLWYLDPPYHPITLYGEKEASYEIAFSVKDVNEMTQIIKDMKYYIKSDYDPKEKVDKNHPNYKDFDVLEDEKTGHFKLLLGEYDKGSTDADGEKHKGREYVWCRYDGVKIIKYNEQSDSYEWK